MKLLVASDIHGSSYFASLLADRIKEENPDKVLLLGDILYHGPRNDLPKEYSPKKTAEILNAFSNKIICVKGNCEAEVDSLMLDFNIISDLVCIFDFEKVLYAIHGHKEICKAKQGEVILRGHTHVPIFDIKDGVYHVNPGSVSIPKENSFNGYIIYETGTFYFKKIVDGSVYLTKSL